MGGFDVIRLTKNNNKIIKIHWFKGKYNIIINKKKLD